MLKSFSFRKISVASLLLLLALILYNYPEEINQNVILSDNGEQFDIYLIDSNDFVAMTKITSSSSKKNTIEKIIEALRNDNENLPYGFRGIIPKDTKLIDYSLENGLLKINFSEELLNINESDENKLIESLIFSLTTVDGVDKIMIFIEGERLLELPFSHKPLDLYLDRNYGVNKVIDITSFVDTKMVTVYYLNEENDKYYVPISYIVNDDSDKISIIIKSLKTNKFNGSNLSSHLNYQVELMNYESIENEVLLNFNDVLLDSVYNGELKEEIKYALSYSIFDTFNVENVVFLVNSNKIDEFRLAKLDSMLYN